MKMMRGVLGLCAVTALLAGSAQTLWATPVADEAGPTGHAILVMNNSATAIQVFVRDARGRLSDLGTVATDGRATLRAPTDLVGPFQIEVRPVAPVWAPWTSPDGIGTHALDLPADARVSLWVETDLRKSRIEIPRG